jgi:NAD(P)H dehydrogenase (quinone)
VNVLVVFYSRGGDTERLALTIGVGAIQARANIRLRRLPPRADAQSASTTPSQRGTWERMSRDYVEPRAADPLWGDVIVLAASADGIRDLEAYVEALPSLGAVAGKIAAPVGPGTSPQLLRPIYAAAAGAGLVVVPALALLDTSEAQHAHGRQVVAFAHALKAARVS